jgi:hypothetical protein
MFSEFSFASPIIKIGMLPKCEILQNEIRWQKCDENIMCT